MLEAKEKGAVASQVGVGVAASEGVVLRYLERLNEVLIGIVLVALAHLGVLFLGTSILDVLNGAVYQFTHPQTL